MKGRDHIAVAVAPAALLLWVVHAAGADLELAAYAGIPIAAALGALVPDIDHPKALIGNAIPAELLARGLSVLLLLFGAAWYLQRSTSLRGASLDSVLGGLAPVITWATAAATAGAGLLLASLVVSRFLPHRGPTHSLLGALVATALACVGISAAGQSWAYAAAFGWGYVSHLLADLPGRTGLPWLLWPFIQRD